MEDHVDVGGEEVAAEREMEVDEEGSEDDTLDLTDTSAYEWEREYSKGVKECDDEFMNQPVVLPGEVEEGSEAGESTESHSTGLFFPGGSI